MKATTPGYYKSNPRALNIREVARSSGLFRLPFAYLLSRFMQPTPQGWMPYLWADLQCTTQGLSERFFKATAAHRDKLERLGFTQVGINKSRRILNPQILDNGGISYLAANRRHYCALFYSRFQMRSHRGSDKENIGIAFTAVFRREVLICTTCQYYLDPPRHHRVIRYATDDPEFLYQRFLERLKQHPEPPREFPDVHSLQAWFDSNALEVFEHQVQRGLFIQMSEAEVDGARRSLPPPLPKGPYAA
jgi:hypothetical protein